MKKILIVVGIVAVFALAGAIVIANGECRCSILADTDSI